LVVDEAETEREWEREATVGGGSDAERESHPEIARRGESNCILRQRLQHLLEVKQLPSNLHFADAVGDEESAGVSLSLSTAG
jgi:hypothetical protein